MSNIADAIEFYLKKLLKESSQDLVEIQRNETAEKFSCVPAQINYVLATRFTIEHGFLVQSRRGGGGYIRIIKLPLTREVETVAYLCKLAGNEISQLRAEGIIKHLLDENLISAREAGLMKVVVNRSILKVGLPARDQLRASILIAMLKALLK